MTGLRIGSLCAGYGGLDMAAQLAVGGDLSWYCEFDPAQPKQPAARASWRTATPASQTWAT